MTKTKMKSAPASAGGRRAVKRLPKSRYTRDEIEEIFRRLSLQRPEPRGELEHVNPYTLLVAVVLSAQATDAGVNRATRPLFAIADTPEKMLALGEEGVRDHIRTIGLFRNKARNVILNGKPDIVPIVFVKKFRTASVFPSGVNSSVILINII